ncbi:hypothetical protein GE115_04715 [Agromyces sp. CFH 90414]|uniref:Mucin-associated surface protein n=1 Tax=Agromyces agglutinans TaxID=2662258 RepID=A0A6I2F3L7_9MICO|nr:hypothetical protein [Agromyces agglutinans]MRG59172.1 hypothetical protein [Agromyces agglutinans]
MTSSSVTGIRRGIRSRIGGSLAGLVIAGALATGLTACSGEPELSAEATEALHSRVVDIAERSAGGDLTWAIAELDLLAAEVDEASATGTMPDDQAAEIDEAIALVRTDLEALIAAQTPPAPVTDEGGDEGDEGAGNEGEGNGNEGGGNGNEGNGGGKPDKGKGNGKDK